MSERNREAITAVFTASKREAIDIKEHLEVIRDFCQLRQIKTVLEYGTREAYSTTAYLAGSVDRIDCVDIKHTSRAKDLERNFPDIVKLYQQDSATFVPTIAYDLVFIDSLHTYQHVKNELATLRPLPKFIMFHDTVLNGWIDETTNLGPGINPAIFEFMCIHSYKVYVHLRNNNGLLILQRV